jgi:DNA-binding MarR family transcriptional regulator
MPSQNRPLHRADQRLGKHPSVATVVDVFTFKMNRFVQINEREGHRWSEELFDLKLNEWRVLALIKASAPVRPAHIAEQLLMDKSQLSRLIKTLNGKLLITSAPDIGDARAVVLRLTRAGDDLYSDMMAEVIRQNELVLVPLSGEEVVQFNEMLDRLINHSLLLLSEPVGR